MRFEGGRREALREGHSEQFGGEFMRFFDIVRGVFLCDLGAPWPPPKPIFFFGPFLLITLKRKLFKLKKIPFWVVGLGGSGGAGGASGAASEPSQPSQPAS